MLLGPTFLDVGLGVDSGPQVLLFDPRSVILRDKSSSFSNRPKFLHHKAIFSVNFYVLV